MLFMGVDAGTQGVRCSILDERGYVAAAKSVPFSKLNIATEPGFFEQSPSDWERALAESARACVTELQNAGRSPDEIVSLSIDGTSGTIVPLDGAYQPLTNAIMYNDPRARAEAKTVHDAMRAHEKKLGLAFGASFSLPRILWVRDHQPDIYAKTRVFAHQADYIAGRLSGVYDMSDYSNALKTGYDLIDETWPSEIESALGLDLAKFPRVIRPGAGVARLTKAAAAELGLSTQTLVTGGSTDGYASALAAGAVKAGNWASIIGTTFVLKGVTQRLVTDPDGSSYSHRLPSGEWLLGGASNLGGKCLNDCAGTKSLADMDAASEPLVPTGCRCYPLTRRGERFPFVYEAAEPFYVGDILGGRLYPALMEGVGFAEKFALEKMERLGCPVGDTVYATGGASRSDLWLRIRASILNRRLCVPALVDASTGSALLAASAHFGSLAQAASAMIRYQKTVEPESAWVAAYAEPYARFRDDLKRMYGV